MKVMKPKIVMIGLGLLCAGRILAMQPMPSSTAQDRVEQPAVASTTSSSTTQQDQTQQQELCFDVDVLRLLHTYEQEEKTQFEQLNATWAQGGSQVAQQLSQFHQQYQHELEALRSNVQQRLNQLNQQQEREVMGHQQQLDRLNQQQELERLRHQNAEAVALLENRLATGQREADLTRQLEVERTQAAAQREADDLRRVNSQTEAENMARIMVADENGRAFNRGVLLGCGLGGSTVAGVGAYTLSRIPVNAGGWSASATTLGQLAWKSLSTLPLTLGRRGCVIVAGSTVAVIALMWWWSRSGTTHPRANLHLDLPR